MRATKLVTIVSLSALLGCGAVKSMTGGSGITQATNLADDVAETAGKAAECEKLRDMVVSVEEETALGGAIMVNIVGNNGGLLWNDDESSKEHQLNRYLNRVGKNLAAQSSRPSLAWTFGVINTDGFNAYSAPGGYVMVSKGLLANVESEAELAGVLAHEIGHVTNRHALSLYSSVKANQCQTALAAKTGGSMAASATGFRGALDSPTGFLDLDDMANIDILGKLVDGMVDDITSKGFAHDDEYDADFVAAELMLGAGYKPSEFSKFIGRIPSEGGGFLSTHPANADRQAKLAEWQESKVAEDDPFSVSPKSKTLRKIKIKSQLAPAK